MADRGATSHRDPAALYTAVMGRLWEDERIRGRMQGRIDARLAGRRQGRSFAHVGRLSARNVAKAATGDSRAAVFKRIRAGGCKTCTSLGNQLSYINDKAVATYSTMTNVLSDDAVLSDVQKAGIIEAWSETWRGTSKLGFTSHMLLSFPTDVTVDQVRDIAMDWAAHFFESGDYGDQWDYVLAVHDDRAHKHAHIVLNNRGLDQGTWFSCWAEGVMSPQLMREKQAEIAEGYGVMLDATTRRERGIFAKAAGIEEIYAAKAEARLPREILLTAQESAIAQAQMVGFAKDYSDLADILDRMDQGHLARAVRKMAQSLGTGTPWSVETGATDMKDIQTVGDAIAYSERTIEALRLKATELDVSERAAFEIRAAPVIADLAQMVPDPELRTRFGKALLDPYPPGAGVAAVIDGLQPGQDQGFDGILNRAEDEGLDRADIVARLTAGGTQIYGLAQDWVERDMNAVLAKDGLDVDSASPAALEAALETVDTVMDGLLERAQELGAQIGSQTGAGLAAHGDAGEEDGSELSLIHDDDRGPNPVLQDLADLLRAGQLSQEQEDTIGRTLQSELVRELGEAGLAELQRGNYRVLDAALPDRIDQITVTQELLEMASEETGDPIFTERASTLQQDKSEALAAALDAQPHQERSLGRSRDLDDDMGL